MYSGGIKRRIEIRPTIFSVYYYPEMKIIFFYDSKRKKKQENLPHINRHDSYMLKRFPSRHISRRHCFYYQRRPYTSSDCLSFLFFPVVSHCSFFVFPSASSLSLVKWATSTQTLFHRSAVVCSHRLLCVSFILCVCLQSAYIQHIILLSFMSEGGGGDLQHLVPPANFQRIICY